MPRMEKILPTSKEVSIPFYLRFVVQLDKHSHNDIRYRLRKGQFENTWIMYGHTIQNQLKRKNADTFQRYAYYERRGSIIYMGKITCRRHVFLDQLLQFLT